MTGYSDCESDSTEVLSVGHEPAGLADLTEAEDSSSRRDAQSRSPSPASSACSSNPPRLPYASPSVMAPLLYHHHHPALGRFSLSPPAVARPTPTAYLALPPMHHHQLGAATLKPLPVSARALLPGSPDSASSCAAASTNGRSAGAGGGGSSNNNSMMGLLGPVVGVDNGTSAQASLKFSIDNILKSDFGRRITDPISLKRSRLKLRPATAQHSISTAPIDLSKDIGETSSDCSDRGSETSSRIVSPESPVKSPGTSSPAPSTASGDNQMNWPAWVYCTRYSDRPSSGRSPRTKRPKKVKDQSAPIISEEKRPRTAFTNEQLARLRTEFTANKYLNEQRRQALSRELGLNESQIKIWFQNKRAKIKKASGQKNPLALQLMAQGLYNHSTVQLTKEEMDQAEALQAK